ncbi:2-succinyl-6-hydroxy-2,4-cyclohexadiene-1-carboxylate synthase [Moellerella wisconsensis]|uniref:2-succinyl-6-hydroxy-2, 4-cyclohexadiene-1-carboxylate synthase n=1 Tax=Moellerella wisconsensis TaxID=158849 RepID=A0ACD3Y401_9GAMM|nr:2-succinyl-6-hydroxy-2,4-cyclohexadiene-1-carboxylate synthase [Moellerella wisconsensis]UNH37858.1 2-succinyl-6-hydroxy-2,4-cyclohexadiene-1-carboxylate synthase [Moellerella wisconsensis]UNH41354.1 2-succinyl-6-hydroxy-2,4-cyclohexadiene-1-carboxylate synthase [Moellerella wisconsensis]
MLAARLFHRYQSGPWLVWLHGLLGDSTEWLPIINQLKDYPSLALDLPGHGQSVNISCTGFAPVSSLINATLAQYQIEDYYLIGYSLGGRLAMYHACYSRPSGLKGLIIEGGNVGLTDLSEKRQRSINDHYWAERFRHQPFSQVLDDWYRQAVFSQLNDQQRQQLIALRSHNNPQAIADMLEATSLAQQPFMADKLQRIDCPLLYLCGEHDQKFRRLAQQYALPMDLIPEAGHNAHQASPNAFADAIHQFLSHCG